LSKQLSDIWLATRCADWMSLLAAHFRTVLLTKERRHMVQETVGDGAGKGESRKHGQIVACGRQRWLVRVWLVRDPETRRRRCP